MAFAASFGMMSAALFTLTKTGLKASMVKPMLDMVKPLLETETEIDVNKRVLSGLRGGIEINNVSFRYSEDMPLVLDDVSLKIRPGQYVAIVGASGCGKSTLFRLLLGFEKPVKGAIYYDGKDMNSFDLKSLRRHIGCVIQNGKLMSGDIFSNIIVSAPTLTLDAAWEAAELAGIAEDIRAMPMGMHTLVAEGGGGLSGGQKQRLMIARAIAPKPKILMLDEATSALDNITQKHVSASLNSLKCTRIVIAHRLSTIKQCSRIIFLEKGKIVEDGTYGELTALNGKFAELVKRQQLDQES
jgi:ABC-type bacteriocin/lantibiotic exporter with double-glycine peptidase domain